MRWLRYNPNAWHVDGDTRRVLKTQRERALLDALREEVCGPSIRYMYYDTIEGELEVLWLGAYAETRSSAPESR